MAAPMEDKAAAKDASFPHPYESDIEDARIWMRKYISAIRDCVYYNQEYKDCKSWRGKFNNYYTFGEQPDCEHWKKAFESCNKVKDDNDQSALDYVVEHELVRRNFRLQTARDNDVWEYRSAPPEDWETVPPKKIEHAKTEEEKESIAERARNELKKFQEDISTPKPKVDPKYDETVQRCIIL